MEKIVIDLEAKTDKALRGIEDLNKKIDTLGKEGKKSTNIISKGLKSLSGGFKGLGLAMKATGFAIIMKVVDKLGEAMMENQSVVDGLSSAFETISIVMKQITNIFVDVFTSVSNATGGFDALQKVLGGGLSMAINIVAGTIQGLVLGVQKAQLAWEKSFFGDGDPKEIERLNSAIQETQDKLSETGERISDAGKNIADNFVEALGEVGSLAQGVAEATSTAIEKIDIKQAISDGKRLAKSKKNFERLAQEQQRLVEQYDLQAEQQRQIRDDESKSIEDRIKANEELGRVLLQQNDAEKETIQARINTLKEEERLKGTSIELSNEIYELQTELIAVDAKVAGFQSEQQTNINSLKRESLEITNSQLESESNLSIERQRFNAEIIESDLYRLEETKRINDLEAEQEKQRLKTILDNTKEGTQARIDAQIQLDEFSEKSRQNNLSNDIAISKEKEKIALESLGAIAGLLGENSKFGKALAVTQAIRDTYAGANKALSQGGLFGAIGAIGVIASGIANVKKITATKEPKAPSFSSSGSSGSVSTSTVSSPSIPPAFNIVGSSGTNQLADAIGGQSQKPVKAYVVSNDVTTAQSMDRNIVEGASL